MRLLLLLPLAWLALTPAAQAHYNMLIPASAFARKDEPVQLTYRWGHPFEHQMFDAPAPESLTVLLPDGKKKVVTKELTKVSFLGEKDKKTVGYRLKYTPEQRGDHVFVLRTPPIFLEEDGQWVQDSVKVVLHVQSEKNWDGAVNRSFEWQPLTRPYGLLPGAVFQAQLDVAKPVLVEVERYNRKTPAELPAEEFRTRTVKTDANGVVTTNLPEAGWWGLTASRPAGTKEREGKSYPVRERTTFWVYVHEKAGK